jgi:Skp family chaperone for outer membrane proteins
MKRTERTVIYVTFIALAAMNAVFLLSTSGRSAFAESVAFIADVLGPAESLKLVDNGKEIAVRNKSGRIAWGEGDFKQSYTIGFVDIGRILNPLMQSAAFTEERESLMKELQEKESDFKTRLDALNNEIQSLDRDNPQRQEKAAQFQKIYQEYMKWGQEVAVPKRNALDVKHLQQAYRELTSAVNIVADKLGVDIVLRFIPTEKDFTGVDADQAMTEIRLRTAVKYPEKLDITTEILQELSLQDKG